MTYLLTYGHDTVLYCRVNGRVGATTVLVQQSAVSLQVDVGVDATASLSLRADITQFHAVELIYSRSAAACRAVTVFDVSSLQPRTTRLSASTTSTVLTPHRRSVFLRRIEVHLISL